MITEIENLRLENESLKAELIQQRMLSDIYLKKLVDDKMAHDLEAIAGVDPSVVSLADCGCEFIQLIENGIDALCAFHAVKNSKKPTAPKTPVTGRLFSDHPCASEFFSSRELDRLSARELEDPDVFKKAMRSLRRL